MSTVQLQRKLLPVLRAGDLAQCERTVSRKLAALPRSPFHLILDLRITTDPEAVARWLDRFSRKAGPHFQINAVYTEMNGFCINPDLWFCEAFGYERYGGHDDYNWLSNWQLEDSGRLVIKGLQRLQRVYASEAFRDERFSDASDACDLLVVVKFQDLIRRAVPHIRRLDFPLLATAHDYDFIYEARRGP